MKIAVVQLNYQIGHFRLNLDLIKQSIVKHQHCDILVFSELALCGYYPNDLLNHPLFFNDHQSALTQLLEFSKSYACGIILGCLTKNTMAGKAYHNSCLLIEKGKILFTYHKQRLPIYNVFHEARHLEPGQTTGVFRYRDISLGFLICEDAWDFSENQQYSDDPICALLEQNPELIISLNASPSNVGKYEKRVGTFVKVAKRAKVPLIVCNQVGGNDEVVFDGRSFILDGEGTNLGELKAFQSDVGVVNLKRPIELKGFTKATNLSHNEFYLKQISLGLKDYMSKTGMTGVVIGVSGGVDSALTLALAVLALGPKEITGIFMPSRYTSKESHEDAKDLCKRLGVTCHIISIEKQYQVALDDFNHEFEKPNDITRQNLQARIRGQILMAYSNQYGHLLLSTGNKSELSVGFTTLYGDLAGGLNLIGDLYKTDVYNLCHYINRLHPGHIKERIIQKAPSAELDHKQLDSDTLLPYEQLDPILKLYIEGDLLGEEEIKQYRKICSQLSKTDIDRVWCLVGKAEFKRMQAPPIIRLQQRSFGIGRSIPLTKFIN